MMCPICMLLHVDISGKACVCKWKEGSGVSLGRFISEIEELFGLPSLVYGGLGWGIINLCGVAFAFCTVDGAFWWRPCFLGAVQGGGSRNIAVQGRVFVVGLVRVCAPLY